jgi:hypothetical protein
MYTDSAVLPELFTFFQASGLYTEHIPAQNFASSLNMTLLSNSDHIPGTMQDESIRESSGFTHQELPSTSYEDQALPHCWNRANQRAENPGKTISDGAERERLRFLG